MTITVSNISESSANNNRTFELAKEFSAQLIALNNGKMKIIPSKISDVASGQSSKSKTNGTAQHLDKLSKVKELLDLGIIDKEEFKAIKKKIINKL